MAKAKKQAKDTPTKTAKKDEQLKVNTSFKNLLNMAVNTPPKKKKK